MVKEIDFSYEIDQMRNLYSKNNFNKELPCPDWMLNDKLYAQLYKTQEKIFSEGHICYGSILQANTILFNRFPRVDCPATIIYSHDDIINSNPILLVQIANFIYEYKDQPIADSPDCIRDVVAYIKDEYDRSAYTRTLQLNQDADMNASSLEFSICIGTTMIYRKYIPKGKVTGKILPVIALPNDATMFHVLPKYYWTKSIRKNCW